MPARHEETGAGATPDTSRPREHRRDEARTHGQGHGAVRAAVADDDQSARIEAMAVREGEQQAG